MIIPAVVQLSDAEQGKHHEQSAGERKIDMSYSNTLKYPCDRIALFERACRKSDECEENPENPLGQWVERMSESYVRTDEARGPSNDHNRHHAETYGQYQAPSRICGTSSEGRHNRGAREKEQRRYAR
jgi:hypothetical protein